MVGILIWKNISQLRIFVILFLEICPGFMRLAFDPKGKLGWKSSCIIDEDPGYGDAQVIEVLTMQADPRYLGYLQEMGIPYIFAGEYGISVEKALSKLAELIGAHTLLLEGESVVNGYFERSDAIDELSLVMAPVIANSDSKPLFTDSRIFDFNLKEIKQYENGVLWLNYKK